MTHPDLFAGVAKTATFAQSVDRYRLVFPEFARQEQAHSSDDL